MKLCYPITGPESGDITMAMGGDFEKGLQTLHQIGFHGIELMIRDPDKVNIKDLRRLLSKYGLVLAAVGVTPMVLQDKLTLSHSKKEMREEAIKRALSAIKLASEFGAPFCIGSFRGFINEEDENNNLENAKSSFRKICDFAQKINTEILLEPQGLKNSNYINTIDEGLDWIEQVGYNNLRLILDFFQIADNEVFIFRNILKTIEKVGLIHVSDSKRLLMGFGDIQVKEFISMLLSMGYEGFFSTEIIQIPDSATAAQMSFSYYEYLQKII